MSTPDAPPLPPDASFADKLNYLFATLRPEPDKEYSNAHVASQINGQLGRQLISPNHLSNLRSGKRGEQRGPSHEVVAALTWFFAVPADWFTEPDSKLPVEQLQLLHTLKNQKIVRIVTRMQGLAAPDLDALADHVELMRQRNGLSDDDF
jgi:4-amino-4-deoxy-L-arabinose transferase-like glycosyltransferase